MQLKYDALHNRTFLFAVFDPTGKGQASKPGVEHQDRRKLQAYLPKVLVPWLTRRSARPVRPGQSPLRSRGTARIRFRRRSKGRDWYSYQFTALA